MGEKWFSYTDRKKTRAFDGLCREAEEPRTDRITGAALANLGDNLFTPCFLPICISNAMHAVARETATAPTILLTVVYVSGRIISDFVGLDSFIESESGL